MKLLISVYEDFTGVTERGSWLFTRNCRCLLSSAGRWALEGGVKPRTGGEKLQVLMMFAFVGSKPRSTNACVSSFQFTKSCTVSSPGKRTSKRGFGSLAPEALELARLAEARPAEDRLLAVRATSALNMLLAA
eukprot:CAMPEP_0181345658 /NCGR_PEP_ID=MMETSP1101-20121128/32874_1 /TAXON_ID=46948 /ORGANISM="Rhodomonas abbreviata, Strain Caron Lab Isolate" /LENGTH=132 /DNA_ID=CAMNT_0023457643 /DNA_START=129 /DNA_END=524 /DNA_ORIENTATION=+